MLFVNGLPLGLIEIKNPADEKATVWTAWQQLQTYKAELPELFAFNAALIASDGIEARIGTLTGEREWFKPWRTIAGEALADPSLPQLQVMLAGVCEPHRFHCIRGRRQWDAGQEDGGVSSVPRRWNSGCRNATSDPGAAGRGLRQGTRPRPVSSHARWRFRRPAHWSRLAHTQGSGKSLTMAFYAGRIIREPAMENPTIVVLTDRNDLDDQLFGTFSRCQDLL